MENINYIENIIIKYTIKIIYNIICIIYYLHDALIHNTVLYKSKIIIKNPFLNYGVYDKNSEINDNLFILIPKNNYNISVDIYNEIIEECLYKNISKYLILYKISKEEFTNIFINNNVNYVNKNELERFNIYNYTLSNYNIVIKIFNISYDNILNYLNIFIKYSISNFYNFLTINTYYCSDTNNNYINKYIYDYINKLDNLDLLLDKYNLMTYSNKFRSRTFSLLLSKISIPEVINLVKNLPNEYILNNYKNYYELSKLLINDTSYLFDKTNLNSIDNYINKDNITTIFTKLSDKNRFLLFTKLMISNKFCHIVINNIQILSMMTNNMYEYNMLYKYLLSYSWIILYCDEKHKQNNVLTTDNFIFDINTAACLPLYFVTKKKKALNPYLPILINKKHINYEFNGIHNILHQRYCDAKHNNICTLTQFKIRLNLFCTYKDYDLFQDIDFKYYNMVIVGSSIAACLQRYHPLMHIFAKTREYVFSSELFNTYLDEYYSNSDIDVMFVASNIETYIDNVQYFYKTIYNTIQKYENCDICNDIKLTTKKLANVMVSYEFINNNITLNIDNTIIINNDDKIKYIRDNIFDKNIKELFKSHYHKLVEENYNNLILGLSENEINILKYKYPDIYNYNDFILDYNINIVANSPINIKLGFTYKYIIETKYIKHNIELFKIEQNDFMTSVANFHLPCVRGYYNGDNVYLTPSCISAHLTFINIDYTYFLCSKDPLFILHKYLARGFGTILSYSELTLMKQYISSHDSLKKLYTDRLKLEVEINDNIFRPRQYTPECYLNSTIVNLKNRYNSIFIYMYPYKYTNMNKQTLFIDFNKLHAIDENGKILPIKSYFIDMVINTI